MIQLEVWGDYALFARGELKVERVSYEVPTPSAARGIVESVYFHPGLRWKIRRIYVMSPIRFTNIRRNEVKGKLSASDALSAMQGSGKDLYLVSSQKIVQRAAMVLRDVHYVIDAHFEMTPAAWQGGRRTAHPILAAGSFLPTSVPGAAVRCPPSMRTVTWGSCFMILITPIPRTSHPCIFMPAWKTAC